MADYKQEFFEFEQISKPYADNFLNNYFDIKDCSKISSVIHNEMVKLYVMYEYLDYKAKGGLKIKEADFCKMLNSIGRNSYATTLVDYCKLCGKFTRDRYDDKSLIRCMVDYNKKKYNYSLSSYSYSCYDPNFISGRENV